MLQSLIQNRRSIRSFTDQPIEKEKMEAIIEAMLLAPTSMKRRPWQFVILDDKELLETFSNCKPHGASFLKKAPLGIVICADPSVSNVWVEDTAIAATFAQLMAESLGLKSCWIQIRDRPYNDDQMSEDFIAEKLGIPKELSIASIIALGYADEEKKPHDRSELPFDQVRYNHYSNQYFK